MRKQRLEGNWSAVGFVCALSAACGAPAWAGAGDGLSPGEVARSLAGEWHGQIQVRSADGELSTAPASMSARMDRADRALSVYYEGFAFGQPVDGAMRFSFDDEAPEARVRDDAANLLATCRPGEHSASSDGVYQLNAGDGDDRFRITFSKIDAKSWNIAYELRNEHGEWSRLVLLQLDRMRVGEASAASENFDHTPLFAELESPSTFAIVETDD